MKKKTPPKIILGSTSSIRKAILKNAGLGFVVRKPRVDEKALRNATTIKNAQEMSAFLAQKKALSIKADPRDLIIGSDQILEFENDQYAKAQTLEEAKKRLRIFSGKHHFLVGTTVLAKNGKIIWCHQARSRMIVRKLSEKNIDTYIERVGEGILASVGCYEVEGLGITLFKNIEGDFFSVLGLPLLPLLKALREQGASPI